LVLKLTQLGNVQLTGAVTSQQGDLDPLDNATSVNIVVRPVGDIDGDGHEDLLWRNNSTGEVVAWFMNGPTIAGAGSISPARGPDLNWRLAGLGDFDGDGKPDLVWRNQATGANEVWLMNGLTRKSVVPIFSVPDLGYQIVGVGDFNGDGWPDLFWRHQTGSTMLVYLTGTTVSGNVPLAAVPDPWQIMGTADFNRDGNIDEVWRRSTDGASYALLLSGLNLLNALPMFNPMDVNWRPVSFADLNGDGKPDLVFRNQLTAATAVIYLDGVTPIGAAALPSVADVTWAIVGPR
jgi:hypothetical protein